MAKQDFITIEQYCKAINYKFGAVHDFMWSCFGENASYLDSQLVKVTRGKYKFLYEPSAVYDTMTQVVYMVDAWDYTNNTIVYWVHPKYRAKYRAEGKKRGHPVDRYGEGWSTKEVTAQKLLSEIRAAYKRLTPRPTLSRLGR